MRACKAPESTQAEERRPPASAGLRGARLLLVKVLTTTLVLLLNSLLMVSAQAAGLEAGQASVGHSLPDIQLHQASSLVVGAVVAAATLLLVVVAVVFVNLRNRWQWFLLACISLSLFMLEAWLEHYISHRYQEDERAHVARRLNMVRADLESILNNNLSLIKGMGIAIAANPQLSKQEFELYAREVLRSESLLINFAAAPDMVVRFVYPVTGNKEVLGLNYLQQADSRNEVLQVRESRRMVVEGPIRLVQGFEAFVGHSPIFYSDPITGAEQFWGLISSPMNVQDVYDAAGVSELAASQGLAIRKKFDAGESSAVFFGDANGFDGQPVVVDMLIGTELWQLASVPKDHSQGLTSTINSVRLVFFAMACLGIIVFTVRVRQNRERKSLIEALRYREKMLVQVGRIASVGGWEYEHGQGFVYWSQEVFKILNVPSQGGPVSDKEFLSLLDHASIQKVTNSHEQLSRARSEISVELSLNLYGGLHKWVAVQAYSEPNIHGSWVFKGAIQDITERKKSELTILQQANYDPLTQLPNRSLFDSRLVDAVANARRSGEAFALLFIDLDRFKAVNDSLGHSAGDVLLQRVSTRLSKCIRETDTLSRRSGDEFTLIVTQLQDGKSAELVALKILDQLKRPMHIEGNQIYITASIGITLYPSDALTAEDLFKNADQAMYAAKDLGRNRFRYFTAEMQSDADERLRLHMDLIDAIERQQLEVFYQPIVDMRTGDICECEALLRWRHPQFGYIPPDKFISLAEDVGLIGKLGDIAMNNAIKDILEVNRELDLDIGVSLNKSYREFVGSIEGEERWLQVLLSPAPKPRITIEITESILMENDGVYDILDQLRKAGMSIAIDDFGTGYSSLSYLRRFPVDWLKIDRSFVRDVVDDEEDLSLVESILAMAHKLDLKVVAEGVENEAQLHILDQHHCDMAQGFYFAKPMPKDELLKWLAGANLSPARLSSPSEELA